MGTLSRSLIHAKCLNPLAIWGKIQRENQKYLITTGVHSILRIHHSISDGIFLQIKSILNKLRHVSRYRRYDQKRSPTLVTSSPLFNWIIEREKSRKSIVEQYRRRRRARFTNTFSYFEKAKENKNRKNLDCNKSCPSWHSQIRTRIRKLKNKNFPRKNSKRREKPSFKRFTLRDLSTVLRLNAVYSKKINHDNSFHIILNDW